MRHVPQIDIGKRIKLKGHLDSFIITSQSRCVKCVVGSLRHLRALPQV